MQAQIRLMSEQGYSYRAIARILKLSRKTVRKYLTVGAAAEIAPPGWIQAVDWQQVRQEVYGKGTTIKQIHQEMAPEVTYVSFWRAFHDQVAPEVSARRSTAPEDERSIEIP